MAELSLSIPSEHQSNLFGQFDSNIKLIERALSVRFTIRGDGLKVSGAEADVQMAKNVINELFELSKRGNVIGEQNVTYALSIKEQLTERRWMMT